uniref:hypothetical protein n=1 Tax=Pseudonocardia lacus TaxID=2835865 RepID=UPI001BDC087C
MPGGGATAAERAEEVARSWRLAAESTHRCDRPAAERALRGAYAAVGLPGPDVLVWADSPLGGLVADLALRHRLARPAGADTPRRLLAGFNARLREHPAGARVRAGCLAALRTAGPGLLAAGPT